MTTSGRRWSWKLGLASWLVIGGAIVSIGNCAFAQITPDNTLGSENSTLTSTGAVDTINGGATRGANLFHSFGEFNVGEGRAAFFTNPVGIENILSRVTGANPSNILGTLGVAGGNANLFLINPNGIIFGPNARLDVGGSFVASTASSLNFADGTRFSATAPQTTPLLTVSVPLGLQFGANSGRILVQGDGQGLRSFDDPVIDTAVGLRVQPDQTLALVGGDVALEGGTLKTAGGRIELGSVADPALVSLTPIDQGWGLGYEGVLAFGDIQLSGGAAVDTSGEGGGDIQVQGRRVTLQDGSRITAGTLEAEPGGTLNVTASETVEAIGVSADGQFSSGLVAVAYPRATGAGGNVTINTRRLSVRDGAQISTGTFGEGSGGTLEVRASEVEVIGTSADGYFVSVLANQVLPGATGNGGNLIIETGRLSVRDGAQISTGTFGEGSGGTLEVKASEVEVIGTSALAFDDWVASGLFTDSEEGTGDSGNLIIETERLIVRDGAQISTGTAGKGSGGTFKVRASESVELIGTSADGRAVSGLFTSSSRRATGNGGNLIIETERLIIRDGAQVNASTYGEGAAGNLEVRASESVEFIGTSAFDSRVASGLLTSVQQREAKGNGGNLSIETRRLIVRDGAEVNTATLGKGAAGNLEVKASESVELIGESADGQYPSALTTLTRSTGDAGDLTIETGQLIVQDGAIVSVRSRGLGAAGNLEVVARSIRLDNRGTLAATATSGSGGNMTLKVQDLLLLRRNSNISTTAGTEQAGGDGGNINIDTNFLVAVPLENSDITADAFTGKGGRVQITAQGIFGIEFRDRRTLESDITASSDFGVDGVVEINTPDIDPSRGLVFLPVVPVDTEVTQACTPGGSQATSEFVVTGRGGLPPNPGETLSTDAVQVDLVTLNPEVNQPSTTAVSTSSISPTPTPIVEAQGWVVDANGEVILTANAPTVTPHSSWQKTANCQQLEG